jgi:histidine decarboxylase
VNSLDIERSVLSFFSTLWGLAEDKVWGYLTSSGTEGNLQGLFVGRESLGHNAILYTSSASHYSIFKIARLLALDICVVNSTETGEMDYRDFEDKLVSNAKRPTLINANLGTTMTGAVDNTREIYRILKKHNRHGAKDYYMHADGALMGFVLPFIEKDLLFKRHIQSISISGHKFLGIPFPCGVFLMEKKYLGLVKRDIEYIGSFDCTISGSRNGHSALFFKHIIDTKGIDGFLQDIYECFELAEYLVENLPGAWRNQNSFTVVFPKPDDTIIDKWQLASQGDISHIVVMQHVTQEKLDSFIKDCKSCKNAGKDTHFDAKSE